LSESIDQLIGAFIKYHKRPTELLDLMEADFSKAKYKVIRDIYVFSSYTGLSYVEIKSFSPDDIMTGIDGKKWLSKDRQKTGSDETVPLLPIPLFLIEKYKNVPVCLKRKFDRPITLADLWAVKELERRKTLGRNRPEQHLKFS